MSLTQNQIDKMTLLARAIACAYKYDIIESPGNGFVWEDVAGIPEDIMRQILFPFLEPETVPDGPFTVFCGVAWATYMGQVKSASAISDIPNETDFDFMGRALAA